MSFEVLPSLLGSLPHGKQGFSMLPKYPNHLSLIKILRANKYHSFFIAGSPLYFDNQGAFMREQGTDFISYEFPEKYKKMDGENSWSYGYPDDAVFDFGIQLIDTFQKSPYVKVYVTITTHPPYIFNQKNHYEKLFLERLNQQSLTESQKPDFLKLKETLSSFIYFDDVFRDFINRYKERSDYENTIFIVTGDHQGYYAPKNSLGKYHVPLIIFSPLLKKTQTFPALVSHRDVTPTIIQLLSERYNFDVPDVNHWLGKALDTFSTFRSHQKLPLLGWNKQPQNFVHGKHYYNGNEVFQITDSALNISPIKNDSIKDLLSKHLKRFIYLNNYVSYAHKIMPDSIHYQSDKFDHICLSEKKSETILDTRKKYPLGVNFNTVKKFLLGK